MVVAVVETTVDSVVVVGEAVYVTVVLTGVGAVTVRVGASGARFSRPAATRASLSRFCLAASMRARAYSMSTARSALRMKRWNLGLCVGVTRAAGCRRVGE